MTVRAMLVVTRYADVKRDLVESCLLPAAERLDRRPEIQRVFLRRHWKHGPQVQLWVSGEALAPLRRALDGEVPAVRRWVQSQPSSGTLDVDEYLRRCTALGRAELEPGPYEPVWPDDTVRVVAPARRGGLITDERALDLRDELCHEALPIVRDALAGIHGPTDRIVRSVALLAALASTYPDGGLARGFFSFTSHLEDFLFDHDPTGTLRTAFEQRYELAGDAFERLVAAIARQVDDAGYHGDDPVLRAWGALIRHGWAGALELAAERAITPLPDERYLDRAQALGDDVARKWAGGDGRDYSDFHQRLRRLRWDDPVEGRRFAAYRFLTNTAYELLPLLDLSPVERYFACHAVGTAAQRVVGQTWEQLLPSEEALT